MAHPQQQYGEAPPPYSGPAYGAGGGGPGYPPPQQGYPHPYGGQPGQPGGYPGQPGGYPGQPGGYPGQPGGYPGQPGGYPYGYGHTTTVVTQPQTYV